MTDEEATHTPDRNKLPKVLQDLPWETVDPERVYEDRDVLLCAVPVGAAAKWHYELAIVTVRCDEHFFELRFVPGDLWEWDLSDVDFIVPL